MKIKSAELEQAAMKLLRENIRLKKVEKVVLVNDRKKNPIFDAIKIAVKKIGSNFTIVKLSDKRTHSSPVPQAAKKFYNCDVIIAPTTKSITHSSETYAARRNGTRVASMPGITEEMFIDAMKVDVHKVKKLNELFYKKMNGAKVANITTPSGTNVKLDLRKTKWHSGDYGNINKKGVLNNVPFGEVDGYPPITTGLIFIDHWGKTISPKDRAWIYTQRGKIVKWNKAAEAMVKELKAAGECGMNSVELGIGTNYVFKKPIGNILYDEKIFGTIHIAFGGYSERRCPVHEDFILIKPTVWVDGRKIMEKGRLIK